MDQCHLSSHEYNTPSCFMSILKTKLSSSYLGHWPDKLYALSGNLRIPPLPVYNLILTECSYSYTLPQLVSCSHCEDTLSKDLGKAQQLKCQNRVLNHWCQLNSLECVFKKSSEAEVIALHSWLRQFTLTTRVNLILEAQVLMGERCMHMLLNTMKTRMKIRNDGDFGLTQT